MEKRLQKRFPRRVQIHYWIHGEDHERKAYTTNVSTAGAFIATNGPSPPGTRMRVEFLGENGFIIEAIVSHAARVSASLQSIRSSGMGIRFLSIEELVRGLLPPGGEKAKESIREASDHREVERSRARTERLFDRAEEEHVRERKVRAAASGGAPIFTVGFRNVGYLLEAIENEIHFGGVFVATDTPAGLQQDVQIALALPAPIRRTVNAQAVVVRVSDPATDDSSTLKGMAVAFKDTEKVLDELNQLIEGARPRLSDSEESSDD